MIPKRIRSTGLFAMTFLVASPVRACPLCRSETGEQVRAGIFSPGFGYHLAATLLPFAVILGIIALIQFGPPWSERRTRQAVSAIEKDVPQPQPRTLEGQL